MERGARRAGLVAVLVCALAAGGCDMLDRAAARMALTPGKTQIHSCTAELSPGKPDNDETVNITKDNLPSGVEAKAASGRLTVVAPEELGSEAAAELASRFDGALAVGFGAVGMERGMALELHMVCLPSWPKEFHCELPCEDRTVRSALPTAGKALTAEEIARQGEVVLGVFMLAHELTEFQLMLPELPPTVLVDMSVSAGIVGWKSTYGTRWFREGLANYVGYVTAETLAVGTEEGSGPRIVVASVRLQAMEALADARYRGEALFEWSNVERASVDQGKLYSAAQGLFMLIRDRLGPEAIPAITERLAKVEYPDGPAVERVVSEVIGCDVRRFADGFAATPLGVKAEKADGEDDAGRRCVVKSVESGSAAERAGLREGDVIRTIDGREVLLAEEVNVLPYDLTLHPRESVRFVVERGGEVYGFTVRMP